MKHTTELSLLKCNVAIYELWHEIAADSGLKEYDAGWLPNAEKITRDRFGRFAKSAAHAQIEKEGHQRSERLREYFKKLNTETDKLINDAIAGPFETIYGTNANTFYEENSPALVPLGPARLPRGMKFRAKFERRKDHEVEQIKKRFIPEERIQKIVDASPYEPSRTKSEIKKINSRVETDYNAAKIKRAIDKLLTDSDLNKETDSREYSSGWAGSAKNPINAYLIAVTNSLYELASPLDKVIKEGANNSLKDTAVQSLAIAGEIALLAIGSAAILPAVIPSAIEATAEGVGSLLPVIDFKARRAAADVIVGAVRLAEEIPIALKKRKFDKDYDNAKTITGQIDKALEEQFKELGSLLSAPARLASFAGSMEFVAQAVKDTKLLFDGEMTPAEKWEAFGESSEELHGEYKKHTLAIQDGIDEGVKIYEKMVRKASLKHKAEQVKNASKNTLKDVFEFLAKPVLGPELTKELEEFAVKSIKDPQGKKEADKNLATSKAVGTTVGLSTALFVGAMTTGGGALVGATVAQKGLKLQWGNLKWDKGIITGDMAKILGLTGLGGVAGALLSGNITYALGNSFATAATQAILPTDADSIKHRRNKKVKRLVKKRALEGWKGVKDISAEAIGLPEKVALSVENKALEIQLNLEIKQTVGDVKRLQKQWERQAGELDKAIAEAERTNSDAIAQKADEGANHFNEYWKLQGEIAHLKAQIAKAQMGELAGS